MLKKCILLAITLVVIFSFSACELIPTSPAPAPPVSPTPSPPEVTPTKPGTPPPEVTSIPVTRANLVDALKDLKEAMLKKIDSDIDVTAMAFTNVKDYWRSKRWADIFRAPLRVMQDTLSLLVKAIDWKSLAEQADATLNKSEAAYQVLATVIMLQDLQEVGEKLHYGLDGPTYISSIASMLEAADATTEPPSGFSEKYYKDVIENHLYGTAEDSPLMIARRSTTAERNNIEFARGALEVRSSIAQKFNDLIAEIESRELPEDFPLDEAIAQVKELKKQVVKSMGYGADVRYKAYLQGDETYVGTKLGAIGELYRAFGEIADRVDEKLAIDAKVEVLKLVKAGESAALLYTIAYNIPGAKEEIKVVQKATVLAEVMIKSYTRTFHVDVEEQFYMLPQEMLLSLSMELSNLWMIADDTDQYLRHLLGIALVSKPPVDLGLPPTASIQLQDEAGDPLSEVNPLGTSEPSKLQDDVGNPLPDTFYIYVGDSADPDNDITHVRFSLDRSQDGSPSGAWTRWFDWDTSFTYIDWYAPSRKARYWDAAQKTMSFFYHSSTGGDLEVWVEVKDQASHTDTTSANIYVNRPPISTIYRVEGGTYVFDEGERWVRSDFTVYIYDHDSDGALVRFEYFTYDNVKHTFVTYRTRTGEDSSREKTMNRLRITVGPGKDFPSQGENAGTLYVRCQDDDGAWSDWGVAVYHVSY